MQAAPIAGPSLSSLKLTSDGSPWSNSGGYWRPVAPAPRQAVFGRPLNRKSYGIKITPAAMSILKLVVRNLIFHRRGHRGLALGVVLTCAIVTGALLVGDSVRYSLRRISEERIGTVHLAMDAGERFVTAALARHMANDLDAPAAAAIRLRAVAVNPVAFRRANRVQVLAVDSAFWSLAGRLRQSSISQPSSSDDRPPVVGIKSDPLEIRSGQAIVNHNLATHLDVNRGDPIVVRIERPSFLSRDAVLLSPDDTNIAIRLTVAAVIEATDFGNFSLETNQLAPYNVFISIDQAQLLLERPGGANLILLGGGEDGGPTVAAAAAALKRNWTLPDTGVRIRELSEHSTIEVTTDRIYFDSATEAVVSTIHPDATLILSYFVNELRHGDRSTPYSMVSAIGTKRDRGPQLRPGFPPAAMRPDEIILNAWCAEDLQADQGDTVTLTYFVVDERRDLGVRQAAFRVREVIPMMETGIDHTLVPAFPGLSDAENCRDWDTGIPVDLGRIRSKDEAYWDRYRGMPKAIITLNAGQRIWNNRFGSLTAVRFESDASEAQSLSTAILERMEPARIGLNFRPVSEMAESAITDSLDFAALFMGLSFFLIVAALMLTGLLFVFNLEQRLDEHGLLAAFGFRVFTIIRLFLLEALLIAIPSAVIGAIVGMLYTAVVLKGLSTLWRDAIGDWALLFHADPATLSAGAGAGIAISIAAVLFCLLSFHRRSIRNRLHGAGADLGHHDDRGSRRPRWICFVAGGAALLIIAVLLATGDAGSTTGFFIAGTLVLISGIAGCANLCRILSAEKRVRLSLSGFGIRNVARRRGRSLAVISMLAAGTFLIVALESQRLDARTDAELRSSGTGGFRFFGESSHPIYHDLNSPEGQDELGLESPDVAALSFVQMRVLDGDDASCLNLNRAQLPRLIGVNPDHFIRRGAFTFKTSEDVPGNESRWSLLRKDFGDNVIPAIADHATTTYALGLKLGDSIEYLNEGGDVVRVRIVATLANSIFQGVLLVDEGAFIQQFPSTAGSRMLVIDSPADSAMPAAAAMREALADYGLELTPATERLREFNRVQNIYITIFQVLGGLGLILGSLGLGVLVLRNVLERRPELAVMQAIGFTQSALRRILLSEHCLLLILGLVCGAVAAFCAVLPNLLSPGAEVPWLSLLGTLVMILLSGLCWTWLAAHVAMRGPLLPALRRE